MRLWIILFSFFFVTEANARDIGIASWYGDPHTGNRTASGEIFNPRELTAAHRTLPFGTKVTVTYQGKSVTVTINDRGPFIKGRIIDLSEAAAERIGLKSRGIGQVRISY